LCRLPRRLFNGVTFPLLHQHGGTWTRLERLNRLGTSPQRHGSNVCIHGFVEGPTKPAAALTSVDRVVSVFGEISAVGFERVYLQMFEEDPTIRPEAEYEILDSAFARTALGRLRTLSTGTPGSKANMHTRRLHARRKAHRPTVGIRYCPAALASRAYVATASAISCRARLGGSPGFSGGSNSNVLRIVFAASR